MDLLELITGNRINYGIVQVGGVRRDIEPHKYQRIEEGLSYYEGLIDKLLRLFLHDKTISIRCRHCGVLTYKAALELCTVGPTARASGVKMDVRADSPYAAYGDTDFDVILPDMYTEETVGDVYDRIVVRLLEVGQSVTIIRQCISQMEEGPVLWEEKMPKLLAHCKKAEGDAVGRVEAPRGECLHYVRMKKADAPYAWKVKASTYSNQMSWLEILRGEQIADIPIIVASIDPCMSCTDRVAVVNSGSSNRFKGVLTKSDLHKMSVEKTRRLEK